MSVIRRLAHDEDGSVVVAVVALTLMLVLGFATYSAVGTQTRLSGEERVRESAFNLGEGALNAQAFVIGRLGPGSLSRDYPDACPSATEPTLCPDPDRMEESFDAGLQADYAGGLTTWATSVRDNSSGAFYDDSVDSQPAWDANEDNQVWVRATANVRGKTRTLVALVQVESRPVQFPRYAVTAGKFSTTNNGNKLIVNTSGSLGIAVRCAEAPESTSCMDYEVNKGQVSPNNYQLSYPNPTAISTDDLVGLEELAQANGTYFEECPANPSGAVVVVESGDCFYNNSVPGACCNTEAAPGIFIVKDGTFSLGGNLEFRGIIYALNQQESSGHVISLQGTSAILGAAMVDGNGGISAGSSGTNIVFDPAAFDGAKSFGTAGIVQNTWREITG
ncbi:MAG: hypothetical protein WD844_14295 [Thermoleophilaceae bacterium]